MSSSTGVLPKGYLINEKYRILLFIKQGRNAESYRVRCADGKLCFLKLFDYAKMARSAFDNDNNLLEIEFLKKIKHRNIVSFIDSDELIHEGKKYSYLVLDFIAGETLSEKMSREAFYSYYDIQQIVSDTLLAMDYLQDLPDPIIHNEITPQNIMLDLSGNTPRAVLIDFGHARSFQQSTKSFNKEGLNLNYVASECFNNLFTTKSDIFSLGAVMYHMVFGKPPWYRDVSRFMAERTRAEEMVIQERSKKLVFPLLPEDFVGYDESVSLILKKALCFDPDDRFENASEFLKAINGEIIVEDIDQSQKVTYNENNEKHLIIRKAIGKGFDAIAGMDKLKEQMKLDVIDALHNPEEYSRYGLSIPNGMLLYGPPGCGKTFFAKHFAEEVGFNFILATPSFLKSRYVNATQENIAKMFEEAEKNAPTIIFIDEVNELLPNRESEVHEMSKSAVNEMLAQMDRTGEKGIFVIGATNKPDMIDPAMLRAGRFDKKFFIPPPDQEARKAMFEMYLKNRPLDFGIDYDRLAKITENYVSADIEYLVNEASRIALKVKTRISMVILEDVIQNTQPSVTLQDLKNYEQIRAKMEGSSDPQNTNRPRIGFRK
jgi:transitional endoplasmic reticulum ATPase